MHTFLRYFCGLLLLLAVALFPTQRPADEVPHPEAAYFEQTPTVHQASASPDADRVGTLASR